MDKRDKKMKTWLRKVDSFFNGMVFIQKCFILFFFGAFLPLAIQNVVYYWQTERNIQEEMLQKANEGMDPLWRFCFLPEVMDATRCCMKAWIMSIAVTWRF